MKQKRHSPWRQLAAILGIGITTIGSLIGSEVIQAQPLHNQPPPTARKPLPIRDLQGALSQTAAVVEGIVTDIQYDYSEAEGPWTRVTLSDVKAHFGTAPLLVELRQFGGPLPNGRMMVAAELPVFVTGKRYIVFLRNTAWNVSPVVGDLALRVEMVNSREVLVNSEGRAVTSISPTGIEVGPALFQGPSWDGNPPKALSTTPTAPEPQTDVTPPKARGGGPDGTPVKLSGEQSPARDRPLLDRQQFMAALGANLTKQGLRVGGTFYDLPAGEFKWRHQPTAPAVGQAAASGTPATTAGRTDPEVDTSGPNR